MPIVENNGVRLSWQQKGEGTPLLLIMGAAYSSKMWYPAIDSLSAKHKVIWYDNRGIGDSTGTSDPSIQDFASDAAAVLAAAGEERAHVFGVSLGGVVAEQFGLQYPEQTISLIVGCSGILSEEKPRSPKAADVALRLPRSVLLRAMTAEGYGPACSPEAAEKDMAIIRSDKSTSQGLIGQQRALRKYVITHDQVKSLTMPTLVLHGDADKTVKYEWGQELAETLPNSKFIGYPGAGHNFLVAAGQKVNDDVLDFLHDVDASKDLSSVS